MGEFEGPWHQKSAAPKVHALKGALENFLGAVGGKSWSFQQLSAEEAPDFLHPGQAAALFYEGRRVGFLGTMHPLVLEENKVRFPVALLELNLAELSRGQPRTVKYAPLSKFPSVERDLAFVFSEEVQAADVVQLIQKIARPLCREVKVFDYYTGESLGAGKKSYAFKMIYQDEAKTLEDAQINEVQDRIIEKVTQNFDSSLR